MAEKVKEAEKALNIFMREMSPLVSAYEVAQRGAVVSAYTPTAADLEVLKVHAKKFEKFEPVVKEFAISMVPIYGSGRDIMNGWKREEWLLFSMGCVGLGLDVFTPGIGKAAAKSTFLAVKGGVKVVGEIGEAGLRALGREVTELFVRHEMKEELSDMFVKTVKAATGKTVEGGMERVSKSEFFAISGKMLGWDAAHTSGNAIYKTVSGAARELLDKGMEKMSVVVFDLNNFKHINDVLGRTNADDILLEYENELRKMFKGSKSVGYGREEVIILIPEGAKEVAERVSKFNVNLKAATDKLRINKILKERGVEVAAKIGICEIPVGKVKPKVVFKEGKEVLESAEEFSERLERSVSRAIERAKSAGELSKILDNKPITYTNALQVQNIKFGMIGTKAKNLSEALGVPEKEKEIGKWVSSEKNRPPISSYLNPEPLKIIGGGAGIYDEVCNFVLNAKGTREVVTELAKSGKPFTTVEITGGVKRFERTLKTMNNSLEGYSGGDQFIKTCFKNMKEELIAQGYKYIEGTAQFIKEERKIHLIRRGGGDWISLIVEGGGSKEFVEAVVSGWRGRMAKDIIPCKGLTSQYLAAYGMDDVVFKEMPKSVNEMMSIAFKSANYNCKNAWKALRGR